MSGGSFNYLCFKDASDIFQAEDDLRVMANELDLLDPFTGGRNYSGPADRTRALLALKDQINREIADLSDLWQAVEWWHSCDRSREAALVALGEYRQRERGRL